MHLKIYIIVFANLPSLQGPPVFLIKKLQDKKVLTPKTKSAQITGEAVNSKRHHAAFVSGKKK